MNLVNENISMDFILEMKEAFQLFDKVSVIKKLKQVIAILIRNLNGSFMTCISRQEKNNFNQSWKVINEKSVISNEWQIRQSWGS